MADIKKFVTNSVNYPEPDFKVIYQAIKDISRDPFFNTNEMKILQDKAKRVKDYSLDLRDTLDGKMVELATELKGVNVSGNFSTIAEIDKELLKGSLSETDTKAAKEARVQIMKQIDDSLSSVLGNFNKAIDEVQSKINDIGNVIIAERTQDKLKKQKDSHKELNAQITEKETCKKGLVAERDKIIKSQDVIRQKNIADTFRDYIPGGDDLKSLNLKNPEVEAIKQGAELAKKILGNVSEGLKYSELADARQKLTDKINGIQGEITDLTKQLRAVNALVDDLNKVMDIDKNKKVLIEEVKKLISAWTLFTGQIQNLDGTDATQASISEKLSGMRRYLDDLNDKRLKVIIT